MLQINSLTKKYRGGKLAVDCLSLHVKPGDIFGFIGPNGAGKTSTIKSVVGIHDFDSGEIIIDGINFRDNPIECKKRFAYIPDNPDLYDYLTGFQYLNFMADIYGVSANDRKERIEKEAKEFGIYESLGNLLSSFSHGMKQKVAIIGALIHNPRLLILDEPFVGLDPEAALHLKRRMKELCEGGRAVFFSTHVLDTAEKLCNRVAIIANGRLVKEGDMEEILQNKSLEDIFMEVAADAKTN